MRSATLRSLIIALLLAMGCAGGDQLAPPQTDQKVVRSPVAITLLPSLGGSSGAYAINDNQVIVGASNGLPAKWTLVSGGWQVQQLSGTTGEARDITEAGVIVGTVSGTVTLWPAAGGAGEAVATGHAVAVNASDIVTGTSQNGGVVWTRSGTGWVEHILPGVPGAAAGFREPTGINDAGVVVGFVQAGTANQAVKWVRNTSSGEWDPAVRLDAVVNSAALGIVDQDIVGLTCSASQSCREPYHWSLSAGQSIGSLGTQDAYAQGLNSARFIVGSFSLRRSAQHAFLWSPANPTLQDLGTTQGYGTAVAFDINNATAARTRKQVVGEMSKNSGQVTAVLWTVP